MSHRKHKKLNISTKHSTLVRTHGFFREVNSLQAPQIMAKNSNTKVIPEMRPTINAYGNRFSVSGSGILYISINHQHYYHINITIVVLSINNNVIISMVIIIIVIIILCSDQHMNVIL